MRGIELGELALATTLLVGCAEGDRSDLVDCNTGPKEKGKIIHPTINEPEKIGGLLAIVKNGGSLEIRATEETKINNPDLSNELPQTISHREMFSFWDLRSIKKYDITPKPGNDKTTIIDLKVSCNKSAIIYKPMPR